jgi:Fe-Mn family superoxide dismutase
MTAAEERTGAGSAALEAPDRVVDTYAPRTFTPRAYEERTFALQGLEGISDAQIEEHLTLYAGYVRQVNLLNEEIAAMTGRGQAAVKHPEFTDLIHHLGFEYNGMILHEYYFSNLSPGAEPRPPVTSGLATALAESFGSVEQWRAAFQAIGATRGVGWVVLFRDPATDRLTNHWITLHHDGVPVGFKPLLVMDVWEHAFARDYKTTERGKYIEAFFRNVDWQVIERRLAETSFVRSTA